MMQDSLPPEDGEHIPVFSPDHSDAHLASWDAAAYTRSASGMHQAEEAEQAVVSTRRPSCRNWAYVDCNIAAGAAPRGGLSVFDTPCFGIWHAYVPVRKPTRFCRILSDANQVHEQLAQVNRSYSINIISNSINSTDRSGRGGA